MIDGLSNIELFSNFNSKLSRLWPVQSVAVVAGSLSRLISCAQRFECVIAPDVSPLHCFIVHGGSLRHDVCYARACTRD